MNKILYLILIMTLCSSIMDNEWVVTFDVGRPQSVSFAGEDSIYIGGSGNDGAFILRLTALGDIIFCKTLGESYESCRILAVASSVNNHVFVAGLFSGAVDFDPGPNECLRESVDALDSFLCQFNDSGELLLVQTWNGISISQDEIQYVGFEPYAGLEADGEGNAYVGYFDVRKYNVGGTLEWAHDLPAADIVLDNKGYLIAAGDNFLCKLSTDGVKAWEVQTEGANIVDISLDGDSNIYTTGANLLEKYNDSGDMLWTRRSSGISQALDIDSQGRIYVAGIFSGEMYFYDDDVLLANASGISDGFIALFKNDGELIEFKTWGGSNLTLTTDLEPGVTGQMYVVGDYIGSLDVPLNRVNQELRSPDDFQGYIMNLEL